MLWALGAHVTVFANRWRAGESKVPIPPLEPGRVWLFLKLTLPAGPEPAVIRIN